MSKHKMASPSVSGGHWQDFSAPVTLTADKASAMYRAITSVTTTLSLAAHRLTLVAGALQLAEMARAELEELQGQGHIGLEQR